MDFGDALQALKAGKRVARPTWASVTWLSFRPGTPPGGVKVGIDTAAALHLPESGMADLQPYILLRDSNGSFVPWTAAQADILAYDWYVI